MNLNITNFRIYLRNTSTIYIYSQLPLLHPVRAIRLTYVLPLPQYVHVMPGLDHLVDIYDP